MNRPNTAWSLQLTASPTVADRLNQLLQLLPATSTLAGTRCPLAIDACDADSEFLHMSAAWSGISIVGQIPNNRHRILQGSNLKYCVIDHIAVCIPSNKRTRWMSRLKDIRGLIIEGEPELASLKSRIEFSTILAAGVHLNLISPIEAVPHLNRFLDATDGQGGILHVGLAVDSMHRAVTACQFAELDLISQRLRSSPNCCYARFEELLRNGFLEESSSDGLLRQTFVFPSPFQGDPFIELIERQSFLGYGEAISPILVEALDCIASPTAAH